VEGIGCALILSIAVLSCLGVEDAVPCESINGTNVYYAPYSCISAQVARKGLNTTLTTALYHGIRVTETSKPVWTVEWCII